jgi:radical SAM-linked protein
MTHISPVKQRINIRFGKFDALKYTGNLDVAKVWERVLRRAQLPILYTQGFNTRPRIALASALPLGITSQCELIDVALREPIPLTGLLDTIAAVSPSGLRLYDAFEIPVSHPALQTLVRSAEYHVTLLDPVDTDALARRIDETLEAETLIRQRWRKGKNTTWDMRPLINALRLEPDQTLYAHMASGEFGNARLEDMLDILGLSDVHYNAHRTHLHLIDYTFEHEQSG